MNHTTAVLVWSRDREGGLVDGTLVSTAGASKDSVRAITAEQGRVLLTCYVDPTHLRQIAENTGETASVVFRDRFLPDKPSLRAGDFGEIFARSALEGRESALEFPGFRWRRKSHKNDTVFGPDLVGYSFVETPEEPRGRDLLVVVEVKTRSSTRDPSAAQLAIDHGAKHAGSRLAETLYILQASLLEQGMDGAAQAVSRFSKPHPVSYRRQVIPTVVADEDLWDDEYLDNLVVPVTADFEFELVVIAVGQLADWITEVHEAAIEAAND